MEEKLRALGVALNDEPSMPPPINSRGQTPMIPQVGSPVGCIYIDESNVMGVKGVSTPGSFQSNTFSPPPLPGSVAGAQFNRFSPAGVSQPGFPFPPASPIVPPPNFNNFHNPRQSVSFPGGITPGLTMPSPGMNDWDSSNTFPSQYTPPFQVPSPFGRGGSPASSHLFNTNILNGHYPPAVENNNVLSPTIPEPVMPENMFQNSAQIFAERHQQHSHQVRRGSPLAHVREASVEEIEPVLPRNMFVIEPQPEIVEEKQGPTIMEPIPKHRRNEPSISLQREMQGIEKEEASSLPKSEGPKDELDEDHGNTSVFVTNPASPVPNYLSQNGDVFRFPHQPEMPNLEDDVHIGAELATNPDDDVTDAEVEAQNGGETTVSTNIKHRPNQSLQEQTTQIPIYNVHSRDGSQHFLPANHFLHSRPTADSIQAQLQHDYDSRGPIQHPSMILVAGDNLLLNGGPVPLRMSDDLLSEDARTNISEIETNPSAPPSPRRKFSVTAVGNHSHHISSSSNRGGWAVVESHELPKSRVSEFDFKVDPTGPFMFTANHFQPPAPQTRESAGGFGSKGFNAAAPSFTPSNQAFSFKTTNFNPAVPTFMPSSTPSFPPEIVKPPSEKKIIPIVKPTENERAAEEAADPRDPKAQEGGRKRTKHEPVVETEGIGGLDLTEKGLQIPEINGKGNVKTFSDREEVEGEDSHDQSWVEIAVGGTPQRGELDSIVETKAGMEIKKGSDSSLLKQPQDEDRMEQSGDEKSEEIFGGDDDEVSSDEAEAMMSKPPVDVVGTKDFNPYEFKNRNDMEDLANVRPSTTFDHARRKSMRTPDTAEDVSLPDLSVDEAQFALSSGGFLEDQPSPPPTESQPPPPPVRRASLHPGYLAFSVDFKAESFVPQAQQPLTPKATGMNTSKYPFISSIHQVPSVAPPSPALSNPYSSAVSPQQAEDQGGEAERNKKRSIRSKSPRKRPVPSDRELDEIVTVINQLDPPYLPSRHPSDDELEEEAEEEEEEEEEEEDEEEEDEVEEPEDEEEEDEEDHLENDEGQEDDVDEESLPWKSRRAAKRPGIPDFSGLYPDDSRHNAVSSPMPKHYRHRAASFSPDEDLREARPTISSYKPPELPPAEKYRSTAVGITSKMPAVESDWGDTDLEGGNNKLRPQSRLFFDSHVEELIGALLRAHVGPLEKSLATIHDALSEISNVRASAQSRRKMSTHTAESDADDEDESEAHDLRSRSPLKGLKLEKIKAVVVEALASANLASNAPTSEGDSSSTPQKDAELRSTFLKATKDLEKILNSNKFEVEGAMKDFQATLEQGQSRDIKTLVKKLHSLEESLSTRENIILKTTSTLENRLIENFNTRNKASEELQMRLHKNQSENMSAVITTLHDLQESVNSREDVIEVTQTLESKLIDMLSSTNMALESSLNTQLEAVDQAIQATRKDVEKNYLLNRKLVDVSQKLEANVDERQNTVRGITELEQKLLDYSVITVESNQTLGSNLIRKSDMVLDATHGIIREFDNTHSRQDAMIAETRSIAQRITEATKALEAKIQDRDKVIFEATKNLENRLYERDMAMVMDAREFVEERLKERDVVLLSVTKTLNDKLQNRDSAVIMDLTRSLDERLQERDRMILETSSKLKESLQEQDITSLVEVVISSLEHKLQDRDAAFAQATSHLAEKLDIRDISVAEDVMFAFAERLKERDENVVEDVMEAFGEKVNTVFEEKVNTAFEEKFNKSNHDLTETRKQIERLINRDHEGLVELTQGLEDALKQRDIAMSSEAAAAFQSLEERVMERENNDSLIRELRVAVEEILDKQRRFLEEGQSTRVSVAEVEELQKRHGVLESLLEESRSTVSTEAGLRRQAQEKNVELETRLRLVEEERDKQKVLAEEADRRLKASDEKRQQALNQAQMRSALLEGAHSSLQKSVSDLSARNAVLDGSLNEAKAACERLQEENGVVNNENRELRRMMETLKSEMEESIRVREGFRSKFNKLQEDMRTAQAEINKEQARATRRDEEQKARIEVLEARLAAETKSKDWFEKEVEKLRVEEREAIRLKVELEHVRKHADKAEELSDRLRNENLEQQRKIAILQVDAESARQAARSEVARANATLQRDVETANNQANIVRSALEKQIQDTHNESNRIRQSQLLEQHKKFETQLVDIRSQHERVLANVREDADRSQANLRQSLSLSHNQIEHLHDRITHLEDKLNVATTAAQAAAQAAQHAKTIPNTESRGSVTGERVSPQALRESIVVLQEQLGDREARVEELEQKLVSMEKENSKKLKDSDLEVSWLKELLTVRVNELEEITKALQSSTYDREAVRDAAVRLKANLEMEQQVRERGSNGTTADLGSSVVANVTELAKHLPLSAAWGSWRGIRTKVKQEDLPSPPPMSSPAIQPATYPQSGFLSGLLTPPNVAGATQKLGSRLVDLGSANLSGKKSRTALSMNGYLHASPALSVQTLNGKKDTRQVHQEAMATPQSLLRRGSYDDDADVSVLGSMGLYGVDEVEGSGFDVGDDEPPFKTASYFSS